MTDLLLFAILFLLILILAGLGWLALQVRQARLNPGEVNNAILSAISSAGIAEKLGKIEVHAENIRRDYRALDEMLRVPKERASLGELALEQILVDQLPPEMFGVRQRIFANLTPDANIQSSAGIICIDSKFPLDNYRKLLEARGQGEPRESYKKNFLRDVRGHLEKIANDYIAPQSGTAPFAFAYIPSESVYYFLVTEAYELLREFARQGVQVVSPLTLSHKIELVRAGVHARLLSEQAQQVRDEILRLERGFRDLDGKWRTFFNHFSNAQKSAAGDLDQAYARLRSEFDEIARRQ